MQDVTKERYKYIGGSDIPVIMGLSPFKTRWELLQEKAQIKESDFEGNYYTEYGNILEPQIREFINQEMNYHFIEDKFEEGYVRYHADGHDDKAGVLLEIKTTSKMHDTLEEYKMYLVQLLYGMFYYGTDLGILGVYERNESTEFNPLYLQKFVVKIDNHKELLAEILESVDLFREDLKGLRENHELTEQDFLPTELVTLSSNVLKLEQQVESMKVIEVQLKEAKDELKALMEKYGVKSWTTPKGYKITLVPDGEDSIKQVLDEARLKADGIYEQYLTIKPVKGKKGYIRFTAPKSNA